MKGFKKLVVLGITLLTLLIIIDTIDAGRKQSKKKGEENNSLNDRGDSKIGNKNKPSESTKPEKIKKTHKKENAGEESQQFSNKFELKRNEGKKNINQESKERKPLGNISKNSKPGQKVKKYKIVEEETGQKFDSTTYKAKKLKPQYSKSENIDKVFKTVKKTSQKKLIEENENVEKVLNEELNRIKNEETIISEENFNGSPKKRKFKLVEVVLQDDGHEEEREDNETIIEVGSEDEDLTGIIYEEISEKTKHHNSKFPDLRRYTQKFSSLEEDQNEEKTNEEYYSHNTDETSELELNDEPYSEEEGYSNLKYEDPSYEGCRRVPHNPNRQGPKKLVLYVVEEEVNGQIQKRVVEEEDGVTMCEVAELLKQQYGSPMP